MDDELRMEVCHLVAMTDDELTGLKLLASAMVAMQESTEFPRNPTKTEQQALMGLFRRIKEM